MIRIATTSDAEKMLSIWLDASIKAHDFVPADFWKSKVNDMKDIYLPASENYVYEDEKSDEILGFMSIHQKNLAALFVTPERQRKGVGSELIEFAIAKYKTLTLGVYKENKASIAFYEKHGFVIEREQLDSLTGQR